MLANEIALNLKYRIGLKQFFNINLGIGIIKKLLFLFVFSTYIPMCLLKFLLGELPRCGIKFCIQRVSTLYTFDKPLYPKNKKYLKKRDDDIKKNYFFCSYFQHISLCFYSNFDWESLLDAELNSRSNEYPLSILLADPSTQKTRNT